MENKNLNINFHIGKLEDNTKELLKAEECHRIGL